MRQDKFGSTISSSLFRYLFSSDGGRLRENFSFKVTLVTVAASKFMFGKTMETLRGNMKSSDKKKDETQPASVSFCRERPSESPG